MSNVRVSLHRQEKLKNFQEKLGRILERFGDDELDILLSQLEPYRKKTDNLFNIYKPVRNRNGFSFAEKFHQSDAQIRAYFAANRSSKTYSSMLDFVISFIGKVPPSLKGLIPIHRYKRPLALRWIGPDNPKGILGVALPMFFDMCPEDELGEFTPKAMIAYSNWGSELEFMAYTMYIDSFRGKKLERIHFDEEPPQDIYVENRKRILGGGELSISMTPEKGITWMFNHIYQRRWKSWISTPREGDNQFTPDRIMVPKIFPQNERFGIHTFHPTIYDNPYIDLKEINQMVIENGENNNVTKIAVLGQFVSASGLVFPDFDAERHVIKHEWCENNLDPKWPRFIAIDCHTELPFAGIMVCQMPDDRGAIIEKEFWYGGPPEILFPNIKDWEKESLLWSDGPGEKKPCSRWIVWRIMDPFGQTHDYQTGYSTFDVMRGEPYHIAIRPWVRNNKTGILLVRDALRFKKDLMGNDVAKLYVCECCPKTISEFQQWMYDPGGRGFLSKHNPKDKPKDLEDHFMQCIVSLYNERGFRFLYPESQVEDDFESALTGSV